MTQETFPLTPLQQGMLLHSLAAPRAGVYVQQLLCDLEEPIDLVALRRAWALLVERHDALRIRLAWATPESPRQVFHGHISIPWDERDWRGRSVAEQRNLLEAFLDADRRRGLDLAAPPLFRLTMFRLDQAHYQLVWTSHHALLDGRSRLILLEELFELYEATRDGRTPALPPAPSVRPFLDWLATRDTTSAASFWRGLFGTLYEPPHPTAGLRGPGESPATVFKKSIRLPHTVSERLRSLAATHGLTLNTLVQGAWAVLLSRYTGRRSVVFGATRAGRQGGPDRASRAVGLFITTVPVPVDVDPDAPLLPWLAGLRARWTAMRAHEHTSLVDIHQWIGATPGRELFDSLVVFENDELNSRLRARGGPWHDRAFRLYGQTNYPLVITGFGAEQILLEIDYDARRFDDVAIQRMLDHLQHLLAAFTEHPERALAQISLLTEHERHQLLMEWNATAAVYPHDRCVHELFEGQVERSPDSVAVAFGDRQLTYDQLNAHANQLAHQLRSLGVGPETLVGLCVQRSPDLIVGMLAILKAGGAYVPLDADYPPQRLAFMLQDAAVTHLVTQTPLLDRLPVNSARVVCLDRDAALVQKAVPSNPRVDVGPGHLAYVMFTSGSTGRPKGVAIRHASIARLVFGNDYATFGPDRVFMQLSPAAFDASTLEVWGALLHGARLVVPPAGPPDLPQLEGLVRQHGVTTLWLTASLFNQIIDDRPQALTGVREILTGGEALSVRHVRQAQQVLGARVQLINGYGPTEGTTFTTCYRIPQGLPAGLESIPIGRPIANTQVYVLDARRQLVPIGAPGELYIGGAGLARGYLNRPDLTAERFVPHPFSDEPGVRLYRTGDQCRWRADGQLEFLGRLDDQVKLRGFRIEPGEIEVALGEHPDIARSVVALREDAPGEQRLVAYCVPATGADLDLAGLPRHLRSRLPDYMVPAAFVSLETLPLTPGGKVDRRALPAPGGSRPADVTGPVAPRTPIEQQLVSLWNEVLAVDDIGIHDNFFALGGHSLLAARVNARIVAALQVELPLRTLFDAPTIAELSREIEALRRGGPGPRDAQLKRTDRQAHERMALSFAQQRLWLLEQLEGELAAYNMPYAWRLRGSLNPEALRRALEASVRRHEPLRTTFTVVDGEPAQVVQDIGRFELPIEDLRGLETDAQAEQVARRSRDEAERPFDLTGDLLLRGALVRLGEHEHVLLLTMHHIASDGWSLSVLWRELGLQYDALCRGASLELPRLPVRYADYATWQRNELEGSRVERLVQYWRSQLQGSTALELPGDRPRPAVPSYLGSRREFEIGEDLVGRLKALSQRESVTLQMTLLAAFQTLLTRYTGQQDLAIGAPTAGRNHEALEGLVGYFVNILVLRTDVSGDPTFRELLRRVRAVSLDAYDHQDLPFERLVEQLQPQRHASRSPLVQVLFQLLSFSDMDLALPRLEVSRLPLTHQRVRFDLEMHLWQQVGNIRGVLVYSMDLFDSPSIDRLVDHFMTLLAGIVAAPDRRLSELPMLTEAERHQLLVEWNDTAVEYPRDRCVHELFDEQVSRNPHATALASGEQRWTYREVNRWANRLAHHLRRRGVVAGTLVGLGVERSAELVVGALGILKAGGAYVPLDIDLPRMRLDAMVLDAGVEFMVTRRRFLDRLPTTAVEAICLDDDAGASGDDDAASPDVVVRADELASVLFTSGSSGQPKGVAIRHTSIARLVFAQDYATFGPDRVFVQLAPTSFDASTFEIWGSLLHGATLILAPAGVPDFRELERLLARHAATTLWLTASLFNQIVDDRPQALAGVREILTGGEALSVRHVRQAQQLLGPRVQLINGYGPTEGTTFTTCYRIPPGLPAGLESIPIGRPIANTQVYVLDPRRQPVPIGVPGELYIGGAGLAQGYLNRPDLTAERFVSHPFSGEPGAQLYRTGDQCRWRADGELEFLGRLDDQVKLRGFRIELGEVEAVLRLHPSVGQCAVVVRDVGTGDKRLLAYVVPAGRAGVIASELRDHLRSRLPDYMLPATFVALEEIPLTTSGKIDRARLAFPHETSPDAHTDLVAPRNQAERRLASLWCELLACDRVGVHDDFFEMGGHSLLAVRLFARIEQEFGCRLPLAVLFQQGTVAHLARLVEEQRRSAAIATVLPLQTSASGRPLFVMPTIGGELHFSPTLVEDLGKRFPVVGVQPALAPQYLEQFRDFRATAGHFASAIRAYQPRGPYALVGYSYGGLMAFEVASSLIDAGETVDLLAVIDTGPNRRGLTLSGRDHWRRLSRVVVNLPSWFREEAGDLSARRLLGSAVRTLRRFYRSKVLGRRLELDDVFDLDRIHSQNHELMRTVFAAVCDYVPRRYPGTLTLFRATADPLLRGFEPDLGWHRFVDALELRYIKGNHESILHPHRVGELADHLGTLLGRRASDPVPMRDSSRSHVRHASLERPGR